MHRILQNSYSASWRSTCCTTTVAPEMEARLLACRSLALALAWVGVDVVKSQDRTQSIGWPAAAGARRQMLLTLVRGDSPTQRRPEKTTINGPPMTAHPRQTQRKAGSPFLFHPALLGGRYLSHSSVLAIHEDRQPRRPQAKRRASVRL